MNKLQPKVLIIGAAGFVGDYLIKACVDQNYAVVATKLGSDRFIREDCVVMDLDITHPAMVTDVLKAVEPDFIIVLAAQSSVGLSWKKPQMTLEINAIGSLNILQSMQQLELKARVLLVGSSEEYGIVTANENPIAETHPVAPNSPYAISKLTQEMLGELYHKAYGLDVIFARAFNHIGPKQLPIFAVSDFASQIVRIERGDQEPIIRVGNLNGQRDFSDVRDVVKAYVALLEQGISGEIYNVGSGRAISIRELLERLLELSTATIEVQVDETRLRPSDIPIIYADNTKIIRATGWAPQIDLTASLNDILNEYRSRAAI